MPKRLSEVCECKRTVIVGDRLTESWVQVAVSDVHDVPNGFLRCALCHGEVQKHLKRKPAGTVDHVEHRVREDSAHCRAGHYFEDTHRLSNFPVL
jgi:hypothetical protein